LTWSADGTQLASAGDDNTVTLWSMGTTGRFEYKWTLRGHSKHNLECTCKHGSNDDYKANRKCPVIGHRYVTPPSPCGYLLVTNCPTMHYFVMIHCAHLTSIVPAPYMVSRVTFQTSIFEVKCLYFERIDGCCDAWLYIAPIKGIQIPLH